MVDTRKGSPTRDAFKFWHKTLSEKFYACDLDLVLVAKSPVPRIVAYLDYKDQRERIQPTFSEVICYQQLVDEGKRVFIVQSDINPNEPQSCPSWLSVWEFRGGDFRPNPPVSDLVQILDRATPQRYAAWEQALYDGKA